MSTATAAAALYVFSDDTEWLVARDAADALAVYLEHLGPNHGLVSVELPEFEQVPGDALVRMWCDPAGEIGEMGAEGNAVVALSARDWAARNGRGYLGSTER